MRQSQGTGWRRAVKAAQATRIGHQMARTSARMEGCTVLPVHAGVEHLNLPPERGRGTVQAQQRPLRRETTRRLASLSAMPGYLAWSTRIMVVMGGLNCRGRFAMPGGAPLGVGGGPGGGGRTTRGGACPGR